MAEAPTPVETFCSYAHEDDAWRQKLETHLSLLKRHGLISLWHNRQILPGTDWAKTIDTHLETASVILLLVSADFLASDYCYSVEMRRALERHEAGEARVIPILVRSVDWTAAPFAHLPMLPTDAKPLVTWNHEDTALADVVAGIRRVLEDLPLLAASAPRAALPEIWNIPYQRNPFFLGRDTELAEVRYHLQAGQTTALAQPQAISGLGGIGKTQLALEYAYRYHQDYMAVLWARAESTNALISSYVTLASLLRLPERESKEQEATVQGVKIWLQTHQGWLLILDNADDLALLRDFLPHGSAGHLLLTTRAMATGRLAHRVEIEILPPEQGALLLLRRAGVIAPDATLEQASMQERELALQISQELGGLPLALDQAGAYLEETGDDLDSYWQIYQQHRANLLGRRGGLETDHPAPVATTWSLSFEKVEEKNPAAADLLRLCAFLAPDAITEEILTAGASVLGPVLAPVGADAFLLNQAVEALRAYSLVRRDPKRKTLSIHRLVQVVLQDTQEETERYTWAKRAMLAVSAVFPPVKYDTWPQCEKVLPQALLASAHIETYRMNNIEAGQLLYNVARYLQERGRYQEAGSLFQRTLHIQEPLLGSEDPQVAVLLNNLANIYREQGKYAEAEPLVQRALHIREQQLGLEHPDVAVSLNNLANLYSDQGKYAEAEPLVQRALHIREQQLGLEHPDVATSVNNLANLYLEQGKYAEAEPLYWRALRIWEQQWGPEHHTTAYPFTNLAELYTKQGKYAEAEPLYQRALRIWEQGLGSEHPNVAYSLTGLADLYTKQGKSTQAEPLYLRALHIRERTLGLEHPDTAETMYNIASLQEAQGNSEEARAGYVRVLAVREQALGKHHPKTRETRTHLIDLLLAMGLHEDAAQQEAVQSES